MTPDVLWEYRSKIDHSTICVEPVVFGGCCLIGESAGVITYLSLSDGNVVWQMQNHPQIEFIVRADKSHAIVVTEKGKISKIDVTSGEICWTVNLHTRCRSLPLVVQTVVYLGGENGRFYCLLLDSGETLFELIAEECIRSGVTAYGDMVIFGSDDFHVYCYSVMDRTLKWKRQTMWWVRSRPVVFESCNWLTDSVLVASWYDIQCLDIMTGHVRWTHPTNGEIWTTPLVHGDKLVFGNFSRRLYCLDPVCGAIRWFRDYSCDEVPLHSAIEYTEDTFLLPCLTGVYCIRYFDGTTVWREDKYDSSAPPAVTANSVLIPSCDVTLRCIRV